MPDLPALIVRLRAALDPTLGFSLASVLTVKKTTPWTGPDIATAQSLIDAAPAQTPQLDAQHEVDNWPIEYKALVLAIIDALNVIRAALPVPLPPITPAQAIAAIRAKASTL